MNYIERLEKTIAKKIIAIEDAEVKLEYLHTDLAELEYELENERNSERR